MTFETCPFQQTSSIKLIWRSVVVRDRNGNATSDACSRETRGKALGVAFRDVKENKEEGRRRPADVLRSSKPFSLARALYTVRAVANHESHVFAERQSRSWKETKIEREEGKREEGGRTTSRRSPLPRRFVPASKYSVVRLLLSSGTPRAALDYFTRTRAMKTPSR